MTFKSYLMKFLKMLKVLVEVLKEERKFKLQMVTILLNPEIQKLLIQFLEMVMLTICRVVVIDLERRKSKQRAGQCLQMKESSKLLVLQR